MRQWQELSLGAMYVGGRCRFHVWGPLPQRVEVRIVQPHERLVTLEKGDRGYHNVEVEGVEPGSLYFYRLDGQRERPDPASRFQPQGIHGPSQVVNPHFAWEDSSWFGLPLEHYIIYELHVGTFTPEGTFDAIIPHLDRLKELGITAVELMPIAQFPGHRNWGYDGVYLFAVQDSYGGPEGLKRLVNACHRRGLGVVLDVVYNHVGPEGNCLGDFGPYLTDCYKTPWGLGLNFDGPNSDEVRRFFIENALYWITEFHVDTLRLDAVHAILDCSPRSFLEELGVEVHEQAKSLNRLVYLIPESAANDARIIRSRELGGYGLNAQWNDDFHHSLHALLTNEQGGYYQDYGQLQHMAKAFREGFVYSGEYSHYRRRRHGISSREIPAERFVVYAQNHDQVGNRILGERLSQLVSFEGLKLAAGAVLLSPFIPLLFMGEEYGETAPFQYFVSHSDPVVIEAVQRGRREEFIPFGWQGEPPDPHDEAPFRRARLNHEVRGHDHHQVLLDFYKELICLRREVPTLAQMSKEAMEVIGYDREKVLLVLRWSDGGEAIAVFHFGEGAVSITLPFKPGCWHKRLDSAEQRWSGPGSSLPQVLTSEGEAAFSLSPKAFVLFIRREES